MKYIDKFLKFLKTDRNTFFTYILTLFSVYFVVDRLVEIIMILFTGMSVSYWNPFFYTFALACPIFAFLFCYGSKFIVSNKTKEQFFHIYVISLYIIGISMLVQYINQLLWILLMALPGYTTLVSNFPELLQPAFSAVAFYLIFTTAPMIFKFLYKGVNDTRLWQESIWDYGGIKLAPAPKEGIGAYSCEMFITTDKETGKKGIIPEPSRFNQLLVVGPSGSGKTSLVFEPMMARDIDKKYFFKTIAKEMGFTALKTGIAVLNCPYGNDYINENFSLTMLTPVSGKLDLYKAYMNKMIMGQIGDTFVYKDLGMTHMSPDFESIAHMIKVAKAYHIPYHLVDPNDPDSIGLNPFIYENPLQTANVIMIILKSMYQGTLNDMDKAYTENMVTQAIENICILLHYSFPLLYGGDRDYLPTLEDILTIFQDFDLIEKYCKAIQEDEELSNTCASQLHYFKNYFFKGAPKREDTERCMQYAISTINNLLTYPGVKSIICNRTYNINYDEALANGELTFVCTRRGDLGKTLHKSFGLFFILLMQNSVLRRPGDEKTRIPHFLYIDEFPEFLSTATEPIFTLYRKYRVGTIISSQSLAQLGEVSKDYQQTIVANCINKILFGNSAPDETEWWSKEFGNVRYWKFKNDYETDKGNYSPKYGDISWAWKPRFAPDKLRSLSFKNCTFKYKQLSGSIFVGEGKLDFLQAKYNEAKPNKEYDFDRFSKGILEDPHYNKKKRGRPSSKHLNDKGDFAPRDNDPIQLDTSDLNIFENEDAIVFDLKKKKQ